MELEASSDVVDDTEGGPMLVTAGLKSPASEPIDVAGTEGIE